jgi:hypothetical protein
VTQTAAKPQHDIAMEHELAEKLEPLEDPRVAVSVLIENKVKPRLTEGVDQIVASFEGRGSHFVRLRLLWLRHLNAFCATPSRLLVGEQFFRAAVVV